MPDRICLSRAKGWRKPPGTIVVARPTKWGNPFVTGKHGKSIECVHLFALLCAGYIPLTCKGLEPDKLIEQRQYMKDHLADIRGHDLACWCPLNAQCHADVLLAWANNGSNGCLDRFIIDRSQAFGIKAG